MRAPGPPLAGPSVFAETTRLAEALGAVNLGQGFPDTGPAPLLLAALGQVQSGPVHQYSPPQGLASLREAVSRLLAPALGYEPDPASEVTIMAGATEALHAAARVLLRPGDRVVVLEPAYDLYASLVEQAGAEVVGVPLRPGPAGWRLDRDALKQAFEQPVALVVINTPHNPTGTVLTEDELELVAQLVVASDTTALTDEVYDQLAYDRPHRSLAAWPGMRERTVTVGAASKTFSATGWRIGWAVAPAALTAALRASHQVTTFAAPTPLQAAVALALESPELPHYFAQLRQTFRQRRDQLSAALNHAGLPVWPAEGSYFVLADTQSLARSAPESAERLLREVGVAGIPLSAFFLPGATAPNVVRLAFCKSPEVIDEAARRLRRLG
ncbi:aminotransferase class I/II-fold pyridoxal phosphate-dependent enzyme [Deinococcus navajonensis]|uniref:Aminotransferase class I/II-fold pyridoxal phosphate-dependent enzyme n=1 Tax=Deinococcus navajonensis TaxID=309884 RepID=A0ABV8XLU8_9DEIO